jgi:hypothetical protein
MGGSRLVKPVGRLVGKIHFKGVFGKSVRPGHTSVDRRWTITNSDFWGGFWTIFGLVQEEDFPVWRVVGWEIFLPTVWPRFFFTREKSPLIRPPVW